MVVVIFVVLLAVYVGGIEGLGTFNAWCRSGSLGFESLLLVLVCGLGLLEDADKLFALLMEIEILASR